MNIREIAPRSASPTLPGADFADAWQITGPGNAFDAEQIAGRLNQTMPGWAKFLLGLRNLLVAPFGLKTGRGEVARETLFPVVETSPERVVLGLDDRHLDFRLVVDVATDKTTGRVAIATTYVRTHNAAGRLYLAFVKPFHRIIVPAMLRRATRPVAN